MTQITDAIIPSALHLPGGNYYDDMRVDIEHLHANFGSFKSFHRKNPLLPRSLVLACKAARVWTPITQQGYGWFERFKTYWERVLRGRPLLSPLDFFLLLHEYRKRAQRTATLDWSSPSKHVQHWQHESQLYLLFHYVWKEALHPIVRSPVWRFIKNSSSVLEFGASLAPYHSAYSRFRMGRAEWTLADLRNFPFHYAKFCFSHSASFLDIVPENIDSPIPASSKFNVIIASTVLEHVHDPMTVVTHLLSRLERGGFLVFDFISSDGIGLDTPTALEKRNETIRELKARTTKVWGAELDPERNVDLTIVRKN